MATKPVKYSSLLEQRSRRLSETKWQRIMSVRQLNIRLNGNVRRWFLETSLPFFVLLFLLLSFSSQLMADNISIGIVNVNYVIENAPQSKKSSAKLKAKFSPQEQALAKQLDEINQLEDQKNTQEIINSEVKKNQLEREIRIRKRMRKRALEDFREELRFARNAALDIVQKEVYDAIDKVRARKGIDIIIQNYVSASKRVNITDDVLEYLQEKIKKTNRNNINKEKGNDGGFIPQ